MSATTHCPCCGHRITPGTMGPAPIPAALEGPEFLEAWIGWLESRAKLKRAPTRRAQVLWLTRLEAWGVARAIAALNHSEMNTWTGIYEPRREEAQGVATPWQLKTQLEAVDAEVRDIRGRGIEHPLHWTPASAKDSARLKVLRAEQKRLRSLMQPVAVQQSQQQQL